MRPLVELGLAGAGDFYSCTGISGYSGGGKKMIADYENPLKRFSFQHKCHALLTRPAPPSTNKFLS